MSTISATKRNIPIGPRSDMSIRDFHAAWSGQHAKFAREIPHLALYVQNHILKEIWRGEEALSEPVEGIAELDYHPGHNSVSGMQGWTGLEELLEDEARFLGMWAGCTADGQIGDLVPSQRRVVAFLYRPDSVPAEVFNVRAQAAATRVAAMTPCYLEITLNKMTREKPVLDHMTWPDAFLYINLPYHPEALLAQQSDIFSAIAEVSRSGRAFLVASEAKRMPSDS